METEQQKILRLLGVSATSFYTDEYQRIFTTLSNSNVDVVFSNEHQGLGNRENCINKGFAYVQLHYLFSLVINEQFIEENAIEYINCERESFTIALVFNGQYVTVTFKANVDS